MIIGYAWWDKLKPKDESIECACDPDEEGKVSFWHTTAFLVLVSIFTVIMLSFPYWGDRFIQTDTPKKVMVEQQNILKKVINIEGMTCAACEATVSKVGSEVNGVVAISASTKEKHAIVSYDKTKTDIRTIMHAIGTTGYKPVGYDDADGHHSAKMKSDTPQVHQMIKSSKCGGGKCGSN